MWPSYAAGAGTGRNRRLLKDRDGRPAIARSGSRRRKESSRKLDSSIMNTTTYNSPPPPCAEEDDFENEVLPALPPSRPSTASPMLSPTLLEEKIDTSNSLYRLALPPVTPASLQPYLEDETPQTDEQITLEEAANSSSFEDDTHIPENVENEIDFSLEAMVEPSAQSPKGREKPPFTSSSEPDLRCRPSQNSLLVSSQMFSEPTQLVPSLAPYPVMPVALPTQKHALANPIIDSYYTPHNSGPIPPYEPHILAHWPQGGQPLGWQHQFDSQGMLPSGERLPPFLETQEPIAPLRSTMHGYEGIAIEALVVQVRKVATDIDILRVQINELLGNVENQAWNVRELERRLDDLRQRSNRRLGEERSASSHPNALERSVLQSKIRILENQIQDKEDSTSLENHNLHAQLCAATHEISHLKEALALKARNSKPLPDQIPVEMQQGYSGEAVLPRNRTLIAVENIDSTSKSMQESLPQARACQDRRLGEVVKEFSGKFPHQPSEPRARPRHAYIGERKSSREQSNQTESHGQHPIDNHDPSILFSLQLRQSQPSSESADFGRRRSFSRYDHSVSERKTERIAQRTNTSKLDKGGEREGYMPRRI